MVLTKVYEKIVELLKCLNGSFYFIICSSSVNQSVQSLSCVWLCDPWTAARQGSVSISNSRSLLKLMSIEFSDASQPSHPLLPPSPPALILSKYQGLFQEAEALQIRWPKYWNFSSSTSRSSDYSGFISFRIDYSDLLVVQGALKSLQYHSSKASIVQHSAFFMVQLSHPCMITGKTLGTFVHKVMSLLFNNLS